MFDVVIVGGNVVDGTGAAAYGADVGVVGDAIAEIGDLSQAGARRVVNAAGLTVAPGFIDTHTHSDAALLLDPQHAAGLRQGVTTEILGQDGLSYAPLSAENYRLNRRYLAGLLGEPPEDLDMSSVAAFRAHYHNKTAINTAYCIPHGAIRLETVGFYDKPLTGDALDKAKRMIREGMEQGAVGLATGMSYFPNAWSDTDELVELCKVVAECGGVYVTHLRDVNTERGFGGGEAPEALEIGRRSGVKVHFSHYRTSPENAGKVGERMALIDAAKAEGVDCTLELYPYPTGSSYPIRYLPSDVNDGGPDALLERLRDAGERRRMLEYMRDRPNDLALAVFTHLPKNRHLEGMSLRDIAADRGQSLEESLLDLLVEEELQVGYRGAPPDSVAVWRQISRDAVEFLSRPDYMVGSDSIHTGGVPHPRAYGCFPRFLGRLRRGYGSLSLEDMVQRMTDNAARRFGLSGRGRIERGAYADIVVFDADRVNDNATYDDPCQFPTGIPYVLVNGQVAVDSERCTGELAGRAIP